MMNNTWIEQRDAGAFWHPIRDAEIFGPGSGDVASLNPRLIAGIPPGSVAQRAVDLQNF
jgi:hypothetical protein